MVALFCGPLNCVWLFCVLFCKGDQNSSHLGEKMFARVTGKQPINIEPRLIISQGALLWPIPTCWVHYIFSNSAHASFAALTAICHVLFLKFFFDDSFVRPSAPCDQGPWLWPPLPRQHSAQSSEREGVLQGRTREWWTSESRLLGCVRRWRLWSETAASTRSSLYVPCCPGTRALLARM